MTIDAIDRLAAANPVVDLPGVVPVAEVLRIADAGQQPHEHGVAARRKWRRMPLAAAALATAGAAIVAAIALGAGTSPPAYAVSGHPDGTVTVTMNELIGIAGANAALTKLGVKATVVKIEPGCTATAGKVPIPPDLVSKIAYPEKQGLTIQPSDIPPDDSLLLTAERVGPGVALSVGLYHGAAPSCVPPTGSQSEGG